MKKNTLIPIFIFLAVTIVYSFPVLKNIHYWGQMDWDQFTFWHAVPRETILRYHQFPLWNIYANGGNVLLAHPDSAFLSPFFILVLIFGPVIGLKFQILAHLLIGLCGMFMLGKHFKLSSGASYFMSFVYMLSSIYPLHLTEGHVEWLAMVFVPWGFLCYLKSFDDTRYILWAILFMSLMLLGGVYIISIFVVFILIYAVLVSIQARNGKPLQRLCLVIIGAFLLCAIKMLPMLEFIHKYPRLSFQFSGTDLATLFKMFLNKGQILFDISQWDTFVKPGMGKEQIVHGWHEYGAYVGIIPLVMFLLGAYRSWNKNLPLIVTGMVFLIIAMGCESPVDLWGLLGKLPVYSSLTVPSRFILGFVFSAAILSGFGFDAIERFVHEESKGKKLLWGKVFIFLIIFFVFCDLYRVNSPIFKNAFRIPPTKVERNAAFTQMYEKVNFYEREVSRSSQYPVFLSNGGVIDAYECVNIERGDVRAIINPDYKGEAYLANAKGTVKLEYFSPNEIVLDVETKIPDIVLLNQNYYNGWKVKVGTESKPAKSFRGLISTEVDAGHYKVTFYYHPISFLIGLFISAVFALYMAVYFILLRLSL